MHTFVFMRHGERERQTETEKVYSFHLCLREISTKAFYASVTEFTVLAAFWGIGPD